MVADRRTVQRWGSYADAITLWKHITGRPAPAPALLDDADGPRAAPAFVEWLMDLPTGWVTDADDLTQNQQITALGNGVLPLQAALALVSLLGPWASPIWFGKRAHVTRCSVRLLWGLK